MLDRISQIVLIVFGLLLLALLIAGLAVSCEGDVSGQNPPTPPVITPFPVPPTPIVIATATPLGGLPLPPSPTPGVIAQLPTATLTPGQPAPLATATTAPGIINNPPGLVAGMTVQHQVVRGEWLLQIARCYGADYNAVYAANRPPNPDFILPGAVFTVPNIGSQGRIFGPPCVQAYTVVAGDTWDNLAARFGTTAAILRRANPGALAVGRQIWAPRMQ